MMIQRLQFIFPVSPCLSVGGPDIILIRQLLQRVLYTTKSEKVNNDQQLVHIQNQNPALETKTGNNLTSL